MIKDYLIVGSGLAGITFAHILRKNNRSFTLISQPQLSQCSLVAAGLYNPVVFYRISKSYMVDQVLPFALDFYAHVETGLNTKILRPQQLVKLFSSEQEEALWEQRREEGVGSYLGEVLAPVEASSLQASFGMGVVNKTGSVDCRNYINSSITLFRADWFEAIFYHSMLLIHDEYIQYKEIKARYVVFCEGHLISKNPFFEKVALKPVKGETLTIEFKDALPQEVHDCIVTKKCFLLPLNQNSYKVGATYNWVEQNDEISEAGLQELTQKIKEITSVPFKVLSHLAGVRPSASDRRPILGSHPQYPQMLVFNGLGTKGVMLAPYYANELFQFADSKKKLHKETDVLRFFKG